jgi:DNA-repair protein complementing XP-A cells
MSDPVDPIKKQVLSSNQQLSLTALSNTTISNKSLWMTTCETCDADSMQLDHNYFEYFHVAVCSTCIRAYPEAYSLLTKTEAKQDYLLTDSELEKLRHITKPNPRGRTWSAMRLYMRRQLEAYAFEKWGNEEGLDAALDKRDAERHHRMSQKLHRRMNMLRKRTYTSLQLGNPREFIAQKRVHQHDFDAPFPIDPSRPDQLQKICRSCGFSIQFESL